MMMKHDDDSSIGQSKHGLMHMQSVQHGQGPGKPT